MRRLIGIIAAGLCLAGAPQARAAIAPWEIAGVATGALGIGVTELYKKDLVPDEALIGCRRHMQLRYDS